MSYRCSICDGVCPHGQDQIRHVVYRDVAYRSSSSSEDGPRVRQEIAREIPVCLTCALLLKTQPLRRVIQDRSTPQPVPMIIQSLDEVQLGGKPSPIDKMRSRQGSFPIPLSER